MKSKTLIAALAGLFLFAVSLPAQDDFTNRQQEVIRLLKSLKYQQGEIDLRDGLAKLTVPKDFNYLSPADAATVLVKLWGNPPDGEKTLGLLMPAGMTPLTSNCWVVTIAYSDEGFVKDDDASKINYDDLLKKMQKGTVSENKERKKAGYRTVELLGWATPPRYDSATHKLYWAKKLKFEGDEAETLNYNIRMLGRRGVLELNAIASMDQLPEIQQETPQILGMVDYKEGHRYADFDPKVDKVAAVGIAALVAGGVIGAKLGFFKLFWVALVALQKFVVIGLIAVAAFFKKIFNRNGTVGRK
jgi:uncharacterized membrane-anchored protein